MHYIVFLMSKGFAPYRDIVDMNMPGSYMLEAFAIRLFGPDASGWFLYVLCSFALAFLASCWIAGPKRRLAGIIAASFTCIYQLSDGPWDLGQRDWILTVLLLLAFGCLFQFLRDDRIAWVFGVFFFAGTAACIKPPAIIFSLFILCGLFAIARRSPARITALACAACLGTFVPVFAVILFLLKWRAVASFVIVLKGLVPYYASLHKLSLLKLTTRFGKHLLFPLLAGSVLFGVNLKNDTEEASHSKESWFLIGAIGCSLFLYLSQGKGFPYHLYAGVGFVSLLTVLEAQKSLSARGLRALVGAVTIVMLAVVIPAVYLRYEFNLDYSSDTLNSLEADIVRLGGQRLAGRVQCLDMTAAGCINVLYRQEIVQSTGFIYDFYLFPSHSTAVSDSLQGRFFDEVSKNPPKVFVLSEQTWPDDVYNYDQLNRWPKFNEFLAERYTLTKQYTRTSEDGAGYRIYELK